MWSLHLLTSDVTSDLIYTRQSEDHLNILLHVEASNAGFHLCILCCRTKTLFRPFIHKPTETRELEEQTMTLLVPSPSPACCLLQLYLTIKRWVQTFWSQALRTRPSRTMVSPASQCKSLIKANVKAICCYCLNLWRSDGARSSRGPKVLSFFIRYWFPVVFQFMARDANEPPKCSFSSDISLITASGTVHLHPPIQFRRSCLCLNQVTVAARSRRRSLMTS